MANRHLSRSIVLQSLFEWDFSVLADNEVGGILERNITEFAPGIDDNEFIINLAELVIKKKKIVDEIIEKAAPDWPIDKIGVVDRNILRMGLCELLFGDRTQVPPKVAINEAIELAKTFGGENSGKFINGVLGAVYKEIGEPGKDEISKKKPKELDPSKFPIEKLGGAVVYTKHDNEFLLALVHDVFGYWTLSKGHIEADENVEEGTIRELKEEIGLDITIKELLGENEYIASHPEKGKIRKQVSYFLAESPYQELQLESSGGLDGAKWFRFDEIAELTIYDDIIPLLAKSIEIITKE
jgi:N utilization substance protein B